MRGGARSPTPRLSLRSTPVATISEGGWPVAEFADGSRIIRYADGQYWHVARFGSYIPGRRIRMSEAIRLTVAQSGTIVPNQPGAHRFYAGVRRVLATQGE